MFALGVKMPKYGVCGYIFRNRQIEHINEPHSLADSFNLKKKCLHMVFAKMFNNIIFIISKILDNKILLNIAINFRILVKSNF